MPVCPNCNIDYAEGTKFCGQCGAALPTPSPGLYCPKCGIDYASQAREEGQRFCGMCGSPLVAKGVTPGATEHGTPAPHPAAPPRSPARRPAAPVVEQAVPGAAPRWRISLPMIGGVAAVLLVAVVAGVLLWRGRDAGPPPADAPVSGATSAAAGPTAVPAASSTPSAAQGLPRLPDGWAYSSDLSGNWEIYVMEDGQPRQLTDHRAHDWMVSWSPDGSKIAFWRTQEDTDGDGVVGFWDDPEIWVVNADGSNPVNVSADEVARGSVQWSPDGRWLAYYDSTQDLNGDGTVDSFDAEVYAVGADGSGHTTVFGEGTAPTELLEWTRILGWAPDSQRLIVTSKLDTNGDGQIDVDDTRGIYSADRSGRRVTQLSDPGSDVSMAELSPDATRLAYSARRDTNGDGEIDYDDTVEIYVMNLDGSGLVALTDDNLDDWLSDWSPDGQRIAFRKDTEPDDESAERYSDLYVVDLDGSDAIRLTNDPSRVNYCQWAPDGSKIVFDISTEDTDGDGMLGYGDDEAVWLVSSAGGPIVKLTDPHRSISMRRWAPNGERLAITIADRDSNGDGFVDDMDAQQLFIVSADGRQREGPLLGEGCFSFEWSEDGSTLFVSYQAKDTNGDGLVLPDDDGEVYAISADGKSQNRLSDRTAGYFAFHVRP